MGNNKPVERKRKKKGRPSLLDLQKRSLRLQKQQEQEYQQETRESGNPSSDPRLRSPDAPAGRSISNHVVEDDDGSDGRREKKLKLIHKIPNSTNTASDLGDGGDRGKGKRNNSSKGTDAHQGEPSDLGPTTPLPDKKLLVFILDRLQKKDTYGVFSEPVDPDELPDYHDMIKHPMDFGTVRKKLSTGAYANLEQFEKDVYLISSNAMQYNSPDTIYYRQARAIHELAKKNFENLRQETDDSEPETEVISKRGRPPSKKTKQSSCGLPADRLASDFSLNATLANERNKHDVSVRTPYNLRQTHQISWAALHKLELNDEYSGYGLKKNSSRYGKKSSLTEENHRNTYNMQFEPSCCMSEPSVLDAFDGQKKQLVPVGLQIEHAYARSLARFAANLGPVGWAIAAKKIKQALPPGTKFGRGWVGDSETPTRSHLPPSSNFSTCTTSALGDKFPLPNDTANNDEGHLRRTTVNGEAGLNNLRGAASCGVNGSSNTALSFNNFPVQARNVVSPSKPTGPFFSDARTINNNYNSTAGHFDLERAKLWALPRETRRQAIAPDLNVRFHSPSSPAKGGMVDGQQPDLALQL